MKTLRRHFSLLALLLAWSSWLNTAAEGPKVLCFEGESQIRVEDAVSGCCSGETPEAIAAEHLQGGDDCDGCEDTLLKLVARSREVTSAGADAHSFTAKFCPSLPPGATAVLARNCDFPRGSPFAAVYTGAASHFLPGTAPLIC